MSARAGRKIFDDPAWCFELKYDGFRALLVTSGSTVRFISRRGSNLTKSFPELEAAGRQVGGSGVVLDGEIIARDGSVASFRDLRFRYAKGSITNLKPKERVPVKYVAFDILTFSGRSLVTEPLKVRQQYLRKAVAKSSAVLNRVKSIVGRGTDVFAEAESRGFEGVMAKRLDSIYEPGKRSKNWLKFKTKAATEEIVLRNELFKRPKRR